MTNIVRWIARDASSGIAQGLGEQQHGTQHERNRERVDEHLDRVRSGQTGAGACRLSHKDEPDQQQTGDDDELDLQEVRGQPRSIDHRDRVAGVVAAQHQAHDVEGGNRVARPTSRRSPRLRRTPVGKARKTCMNAANGARSNAMPIVKTRLELAEETDDNNVTDPAAIIRSPKRLSGLRYQANSPPRM